MSRPSGLSNKYSFDKSRQSLVSAITPHCPSAFHLVTNIACITIENLEYDDQSKMQAHRSIDFQNDLTLYNTRVMNRDDEKFVLIRCINQSISSESDLFIGKS